MPNSKTNAERQADYQSKLREMTPVERALFKAGYREGFRPPDPYTPEQREMVDRIRALLMEAASLAGTLNAGMRHRLVTEHAEHTGKDCHNAMSKELETVTRFTLPSY
jgi:hypothetical protein